MKAILLISAFIFSLGASADFGQGFGKDQSQTASGPGGNDSTLKGGENCNVAPNAECADEKPAKLPQTCEAHYQQVMRLCEDKQIDKLIANTNPAMGSDKSIGQHTSAGPQQVSCAVDYTRETHGKVLKHLNACKQYQQDCMKLCQAGQTKQQGFDTKQAGAKCQSVTEAIEKLAKHQGQVRDQAVGGAKTITSFGGKAPAKFGAQCKNPIPGYDPNASEDQPEPSQQAGNGEGENGGGGGGGEGLGNMLSSLLPLAMMAAMMPDDEAYEPKKAIEEKDPIAAFCLDNPDSQVCVSEVDCSNEEVAALNPQQCLCSDPQVARVTPICNQKPAPGNFASLEPTVSDSRGLLGTSGLTDLLSGPPAVLPVDGGAVGVDANQRGGGGGGPNSSGGPSAKLGDGGGGGHAPGPYNTDIMKGVGKGGGGGAGGGAGGGYQYAGGANDDGGDESDFNLQKYLPEEEQRGVAGVAAARGAGLTGPFGPSVWQKISLRYKKLQPFLKK